MLFCDVRRAFVQMSEHIDIARAYGGERVRRVKRGTEGEVEVR